MKKKLFYVVNDDWFFLLHRIPTLQAAVQADFDITLITRIDTKMQDIENRGVRVIPFPFNRQSRNPFVAVMQILKLALIYHREKPDIVHHIALKPILFGSLAAWAARVPCVVNGFVGLGTLFYGDILLARLLRPLLFPLLRGFARCDRVWTLFENEDDRARMIEGGMAQAERSLVIPGSGVDVNHYIPYPLPPSPPFICMFAGRLIAMKGLQTIYDAFEILKKESPHIQLWICGMPDPGNPQSWTAQMMESWCNKNPHIIWKGHQPDMAVIWPQVHLALQPTIGGEGLPVSLLEAAACARPLLATDVPGCREIVIDGLNGLFVPERDPVALAQTIQSLSADLPRCIKMGEEGRKRTADHFSATCVTNAVYALYKRL